MTKKITDMLEFVEHEENVNIFFACEAGSRAWGFPSTDSDYDVRFIYVRPLYDYAAIKPFRDVIDIEDECVKEIKRKHPELDFSGWDLLKALRLLYKSNPPLFEWLHSPTCYKFAYEIAEKMIQASKTFYSPRASLFHYYHMADGNYREYLKGAEVWTKKYLYVLRPILACMFIHQKYEKETFQNFVIPPVDFNTLVHNVSIKPTVKNNILNLLAIKRRGSEMGQGPADPILNDFIATQLDNFNALRKQKFGNLPGNFPHTPTKLENLFKWAITKIEMESKLERIQL